METYWNNSHRTDSPEGSWQDPRKKSSIRSAKVHIIRNEEQPPGPKWYVQLVLAIPGGYILAKRLNNTKHITISPCQLDIVERLVRAAHEH